MTEFSGDKNYIDNLLKALPVEEAIVLFSKIDNRILQLLECSSDDFLSLNDHFKNYHKESKNLVKSASEIIEIITDYHISNSFSNLKKYCDSFCSLTNFFTQHVEFLDVEIKKTTNKFESLKIANNNFRQNIISLKVLLTNLKLESFLTNDRKKGIEIIEKKIEVEKSLLLKTDLLIEQFVNNAQVCFVLLSSIKKENYQQLQKLNDNIETSFTLFRKKYDEASKIFPALKELTDKNASNIAKIITNLQYHDIIRQKIEHIQKTHKDIITDLKSFKEEDNSIVLLHNKAKTFLKIRDVAGLQAAQLLHANRQYQMAIEEIGANLEEIGNEMITISSICENLVGKSSQTKDYYLNNILENLNNALNYNNKLSEFISAIKNHTQSLSDTNNEFSAIYKEMNNEFSFIKDLIIEIFDEIPVEANSQNVDQILALIRETETLQSHIGDIHYELIKKVNNIVNPKENFLIETNILVSLNELGNTIPGLISLLKNSIQQIDEHLYFNTNTSLNVSDNIKNSLKKIKYYDFFEKACDSTIEELNSINLKLNYGSGKEAQSRIENLKHLKARYTMASEHVIHEKMSKISDISDLYEINAEEIINITNENSESDDENLELF